MINILTDLFNSFNLSLRISMTNKHKKKLNKLRDKVAMEEMIYEALLLNSLKWCEEHKK